MKHELKMWPESFNPLWSGDKTFELREDDLGFKVDDLLKLKEWSEEGRKSGGYTGREITATVMFVMSGLGLEKDWVAMSLSHFFLKPKD
ncbi:hypothetical protein LCGC14_2668210 [marine sediment metagenome]|uniref:DUF3850 domain-containing protein n=1 Tax=marine sediment metagenome TaxID=412755 RepID=A0A0F9ACB6_9ZZZZ|nr:DUF3850 domain-containing protein [Desulfobacterales bacterium]